jgi:predicted RNA-binding Zn-ribbon protein involved in translation (DUF1610 family)
MLPPPRKVWTGAFASFPCPVCGAKVFDNVKDKKNPKAPDYRCAESSCRWAEWIPEAR